MSEATSARGARARPARGAGRVSPGLAASIGWIALVVALAVLAPWLPLPGADEQDLLNALAHPGADAWLGTDSLGRDTLTRLIHGGRVSLAVSLGSVAIGMLAGGTLGLVAGFYGRWNERLIMGAMTVLLCFPGIILAIALVSSLGPNLTNVTLAIGVIFMPAFARIARANTLSLRHREFVLAAQVLGARTPRILLREVLPNLMPVLMSYAVVMLGVAILAEAALGFLGLSVRPPQPSWGGMIASERSNLTDAPLAVFVPAMWMTATVLAINRIGESVRGLFDVKAQAL